MGDPNFPNGLDIKPLHVGSEFDNDFDYDAQQEAIQTYGIAGRVWEASYQMILYLNPPDFMYLDPPPRLKERGREPFAILELGSGTGIAASCMANLLQKGDLLIVTDLPEVCPLLEKNLSKHSGTPAQLAVRPLTWGNLEHTQAIAKEFQPLSLTHIVCSDLVYFPELLAPLLRSLIHVTSLNLSNSNPGPTVIISYKIRSLTKENPFWSAFGLWFDFYPVNRRSSPTDDWRRMGDGQDDQMFVFTATRRKGSQSWDIPERDEDLLAGVGANGTPNPKSDDTFETLLLFSVDDML